MDATKSQCDNTPVSESVIDIESKCNVDLVLPVKNADELDVESNCDEGSSQLISIRPISNEVTNVETVTDSSEVEMEIESKVQENLTVDEECNTCDKKLPDIALQSIESTSLCEKNLNEKSCLTSVSISDHESSEVNTINTSEVKFSKVEESSDTNYNSSQQIEFKSAETEKSAGNDTNAFYKLQPSPASSEDSESDSSSSWASFSDASSSEDIDDDDETKVIGQKRSSSENVRIASASKKAGTAKRNKNLLKGELDIDDLPPVEDLTITVPEEECEAIAAVYSIVNQFVVVESLPNTPPLNLDSILFRAKGKPLGLIFDVFGPVKSPFYCIRFNSNDDIVAKGISIGEVVYCAPQTEHTKYVFTYQLMMQKGSDASWRHNHEPPQNHLDYSDDEEERAAKQKSNKAASRNVQVKQEPGEPKRKQSRQNFNKKNSSNNINMGQDWYKARMEESANRPLRFGPRPMFNGIPRPAMFTPPPPNPGEGHSMLRSPGPFSVGNCQGGPMETQSEIPFRSPPVPMNVRPPVMGSQNVPMYSNPVQFRSPPPMVRPPLAHGFSTQHHHHHPPPPPPQRPAISQMSCPPPFRVGCPPLPSRLPPPRLPVSFAPPRPPPFGQPPSFSSPPPFYRYQPPSH